MDSHELANLLLSKPDMPIAVCGNGHVYMSKADRVSHGPLEVGLLNTYAGDHVVIGDMLKYGCANAPNWSLAEKWRRP